MTIKSFFQGMGFFLIILIPLAWILHNIEQARANVPPVIVPVEVLTATLPTVLDSHPVPFKSEVECLALNMYHEARGEGLDGLSAVSEVVLNRVEDKRFPNSVCEVIYQNSQFSWTLVGSLRIDDKKEYEKIYTLAEGMLAYGIYRQLPAGTVYYINPKKLKRIPAWTKRVTWVKEIGNHKFAKA